MKREGHFSGFLFAGSSGYGGVWHSRPGRDEQCWWEAATCFVVLASYLKWVKSCSSISEQCFKQGCFSTKLQVSEKAGEWGVYKAFASCCFLALLFSCVFLQAKADEGSLSEQYWLSPSHYHGLRNSSASDGASGSGLTHAGALSCLGHASLEDA